MSRKIRLGISRCLLGEKVRYDGNHKHDGYIVKTLGRFFKFVPVCPEVAIGLGVPRPPIRLIGNPDKPRAAVVDDPGLDVTGKLTRYGRRTARELGDISGYIFKSGSPSCGVARVKVYGANNRRSRRGSGVYARAFMAENPLLPVEEEDRLGDPVLRENFIERVWVYHRWQRLTASGLTPAKLAAFHVDHETLIMAHGIEHLRALERLGRSRHPAFRDTRASLRFVTGVDERGLKTTADAYIRLLMATLKRRATRPRHTKVLMHFMGHLNQYLSPVEKRQVLKIINAYRLGRAPLAKPVAILNRKLQHYRDPYITRQVYLNPYPPELKLRHYI